VPKKVIQLTDVDRGRLRNLVDGSNPSLRRQAATVDELERLLEEATVVPAPRIGPDVVTMNSEVRVRDLATQQTRRFVLVFPHSAKAEEGRISVLAPLGMAVLGRRKGDRVSGQAPGGTRQWRIEDVGSGTTREGHDVA
jgi:regulator of nucleoside diphosphate kinase